MFLNKSAAKKCNKKTINKKLNTIKSISTECYEHVYTVTVSKQISKVVKIGWSLPEKDDCDITYQ